MKKLILLLLVTVSVNATSSKQADKCIYWLNKALTESKINKLSTENDIKVYYYLEKRVIIQSIVACDGIKEVESSIVLLTKRLKEI